MDFELDTQPLYLTMHADPIVVVLLVMLTVAYLLVRLYVLTKS